MRDLPHGTVIFLVTDIEAARNSGTRFRTRYRLPTTDTMRFCEQATEANCSVAFKTIGDASQLAFPTAVDAISAAKDA